MSLADDIYGEQTENLAVLFCDINQTESMASGDAQADVALWRVNYFRTARELAADHGGREATTLEGGWAATFDSTVEALVCARELSSLVGWQTGGPSLSGGLSAGEVNRDPFGIDGSPVREAIALCRQARPRQVLVASPLQVVMTPDTAHSFASARPEFVVSMTEDDAETSVPSAVGERGFVPGGSGLVVRGHDFGFRRGAVDRPSATENSGVPERSLRLLRDPAGSSEAAPVAPGERLCLSVLGWVQLERSAPGSERTTMRGSQARAVLSMLVLRHGPVHKDELAELLWPATLPDHWEGALRGLITKIRRFLDAGGLVGREVLVGEDGYYELRLPPGVVVDRDHAAALISRAEAALDEREPNRAAELVREAVSILDRRVLSGQDNGWFDQVRTELTHERLVALELLARADMEMGSIEGAKQAAIKALSIDPYRESSFRLLMQAHAAAGSRGEALRTYEQCRRMLADELGVGPSAQTQALYIHLLG